MRIARDDANAPWLTLPQAIVDLDDLFVKADPIDAAFLEEHRVHLATRMEKAALSLSPAASAVAVSAVDETDGAAPQ